MNHHRGEYIRLLLDGELNQHLHEIGEKYYARMEQLIERMKAGCPHTILQFATNKVERWE